ncbi:outer membrane protein assembly factor BamB family protein [Streptomyces litchfieldiae]|uniref:PQQ-binding-like beta-propeller repeat protein n=1 Tax=Streptomyces litchfieldiae TaxID=3075543 RepID=A0ABU2MTG6_9ACTN|nr:PQQ-binding-like beta-propeller repeat protein [Streptomyces sp. DSM 44938]MDT0344929.1 PQQ-binding-like beta-propeller repeat protein [Streptomyces sp. DSM 44938]
MAGFGALEPGDPSQVGRYRIVGRLGAGGMGRVYVGQSRSGRLVAVKVVRPELAEEPEFRRRFAREVAAARRVNGAYTAAVLDADPEGSPPWLVTAFVPGMSLETAVAEHGPWPLENVRALGARLAEALQSIHEVRVIHRDLKPANVLLGQDGPRVIDFGISRAVESSGLTRTGTVLGSAGFMSPEQLRAEQVGPASDVFALGAVLAYTATGNPPFGSGSIHAINFRAVYEPADLAGMPDELRPVVEACLDKKPGERPCLQELLDELTGAPGRAMPVEWLPAPVARALAGPTAPPVGTSLPTEPSPPPGTPVAPTRRESRESSVDTPPERPSAPTVPSSPGPRRRALLGLAVATGVAGAGLGAWRLIASEDDSPAGSTGGPPPVSPGELVWRVATEEWGIDASPAVAGGAMYVGSDHGYLYALDAASAEERWRCPVGGDTLSTPVVSGDVVYVSGDRGYLTAVDATGAAGTEKWLFTEGGQAFTLPTVAGGLVFAGSVDGRLYAVDAGGGSQAWRFATGGEIWSPPAVADEVAYVGSQDGHLYAVDTGSGEERWRFPTGGPVGVSPAVSGGVVFFGGEDPHLYAVDVASGRERWRFTAGDSVWSWPTVTGGVVYVGSRDGHLYAVDATSGNERWRFRTGGGSWSAPAVADGVAYVGSQDGHLFAVDTGSGEERWRYRTGDEVWASPVVADGVVYVASRDGHLYAVRA